MSLLPKISVVFDDETKTVTITDTTGFYNETSNPGGYGTPNLDRSQITSAQIVIQHNKEPFYSKDVTSIIKASLDAEVDLGVIDAVLEDDGVYRAFLVVNTYPSFGELVFMYEGVKKALSVYWSRLAGMYDIQDKQDLERECIWLEANVQALPSLERRGMESEFLNLLRFIQKRFEVDDILIV